MIKQTVGRSTFRNKNSNTHSKNMNSHFNTSFTADKA